MSVLSLLNYIMVFTLVTLIIGLKVYICINASDEPEVDDAYVSVQQSQDYKEQMGSSQQSN